MFSKRIPRLAMVGTKKSFPSSNYNRGILSLVTSNFANQDIVVSNCFSSVLPSPILFCNLDSRFTVGSTSLPCFSVRSMSSKKSPQPRMGSIMKHLKYMEMYENLSEAVRSSSSLGPLEIVCYHILSKEIHVNQDILKLNALSPSSHLDKGKRGYARIKELKKSGALKVGKFNIHDDQAIKAGFKALLDETRVDKEALVEELFAENERAGGGWDEALMLKGQLVGFWLLRFVENGHMQLPMKTLDRLNVILHGGKFTKEEDNAILDWVKENGETGWQYLARSLGRNYLRAGAVVKERYETLVTINKGAFSQAEEALLIRDVLKQVLDAMEKPYHESDLNFRNLESQMRRPSKIIREHYVGIIHPTIMRYKAGALDKDVRVKLIQKVKENKWMNITDVKFDKLALMPEFKGHNRTSLNTLYKDLAGKAKEKFKLKSQREVTVEQVEAYLATSQRHAKSEKLIERQKWIVNEYNTAKKELM